MKIETMDQARGMLERIQRAVDRKDYDTAHYLERQLWENALEAAAIHICRSSPSDLCATVLTSRNIHYPRGYSP